MLLNNLVLYTLHKYTYCTGWMYWTSGDGQNNTYCTHWTKDNYLLITLGSGFTYACGTGVGKSLVGHTRYRRKAVFVCWIVNINVLDVVLSNVIR